MKPLLSTLYPIALLLGVTLLMLVAEPSALALASARPSLPSSGCSQGELLGGLAAAISSLALLFRKKRRS
jgi:hypothetical protein